MGHLVQIGAGYRGVELPNLPEVLKAGDQVTITNANFNLIPGAWIGHQVIDVNPSVPDPVAPDAQVAIDVAQAYTNATAATTLTSAQTYASSAATTAATAAQTAAQTFASSAATAAQNAALTGAQTYADANKVGKGTLMVSVLDYGAVGDGTTLDQAAINAAITANPGKTILFPKTATSIYLVDGLAYTISSQPVAIKLNQPGVRLLLDPGVTIKVQTNNSQKYSIIHVTAADCVIEGGTILGDSATHTGSTGEWGHCIDINSGAHRCWVRGVHCKQGWGDGIVISGAVLDATVENVVSEDNRRQGLSITDAVRPRIIGGAYINTGLTATTGPSAGIDLEPSSGQSIVDAELIGVLASGNKGAGILTSSNARPFSASVVGCRAVNNGAGGANNGFMAAGTTNNTSFISCEAAGNTQDGFLTYQDTVGIKVSNCIARANTRFGVCVVGTYSKLTSPITQDNGRSGIYVDPNADSVTITGGESIGNSALFASTYANVDLQATNARVSSHHSDAGTAAARPAYGFLVRTAATGAKILGCEVRNAFATANVLDQSGVALIRPLPGGSGSSTVQTFTSTGTWTKPAGAKTVVITLVGGGGGGGSGRRGAGGTVRSGGGGGGGGAWSTGVFQASDLASTVTVTIGAGGTSGAAQTTNDTNGNAGGTGANTTFGGHLAGRGGGGGGAGSTGAGSAGAGGLGHAAGVVGGASSASGGVGAGGGATAGAGGAGGGGAGGGIGSDAANSGNGTPANGGNGSQCFTTPSTVGGSAGVVDTTTPTQGTAGTIAYSPAPGAAGGAASVTTTAQSGATGLQPGGGGGGGGASLNGNNSGAGGVGGAGVAVITTNFD